MAKEIPSISVEQVPITGTELAGNGYGTREHQISEQKETLKQTFLNATNLSRLDPITRNLFCISLHHGDY